MAERGVVAFTVAKYMALIPDTGAFHHLTPEAQEMWQKFEALMRQWAIGKELTEKLHREYGIEEL